MLVQIITENGVKKIKPLTADAGAGLPVGFIGHAYKKGNYSGWLYCDGSTFDETQYPLLYAYLGTNVLPDLREVGLKGAEKNTTYIFDSTETDPRTGQAGTQNHDVFTQGQFKDDQLQTHSHGIQSVGLAWQGGGNQVCSNQGGDHGVVTLNNSGRSGTVTRGKSFGVFYYIKATSGLSENAQDNVVAQLNEERSYSTSEVNTGKKWIDGKPIYRKVYTGVDIAITQGSWNTLATGLTNIETLTDLRCFNVGSGSALTPFFMYSSYINSSGVLAILPERTWAVKTFIIEYTKTTD